MSLQDSERIRLILNGSIPSMLFKLATPNMISVIFMLVITYSEIFFAGQLGIIPLAAVAVVFPASPVVPPSFWTSGHGALAPVLYVFPVSGKIKPFEVSFSDDSEFTTLA